MTNHTFSDIGGTLLPMHYTYYIHALTYNTLKRHLEPYIERQLSFRASVWFCLTVVVIFSCIQLLGPPCFAIYKNLRPAKESLKALRNNRHEVLKVPFEFPGCFK